MSYCRQNNIGNNVYNNQIINPVHQHERQNMNQNYNNANKGPQYGIIPNMGFNQNVLNSNNGQGQNSSTEYQNYSNLDNLNSSPSQQINFLSDETLSGETLSVENFTHNNMVPFFGGSVTQNTDAFAGDNTLSKYTGIETFYQPKKETKSFQDVSPNIGNVNGSSAFTIDPRVQGRYLPSEKRQGEKPFEEVRVGPGLNKGYTSAPSGGFQQNETLQYVQQKNVDELRVKSKPKATGLEGRINPGSLSGGTRGKISELKKNRPDTFYHNSPERYLKTGGSLRAAKLRNKFYQKPTNRRISRKYFGLASPTDHTKPYKTGAYQKSRRNNYMNDGPRNANAKDTWCYSKETIEGGVGDYGASSIENKPNERDITQHRPVTNNVTSQVKKLIAPVLDIFKKTRKENFVGNVRPEGNMKASMPSKPTIKDPSDVTRTTLKETNIHNNHEGFIVGNEKGIVYDPDDVARTTIKETNIHNNSPYMNMAPQQPTSLRVYDPEDVAKTTVKETSIHNDHYGFMDIGSSSQKYGGYGTANVIAKNTTKQFTSDYEYSGNADGQVGTGQGRGYLSSRYKAKNTHKQFLSNKEYKGSAGSTFAKKPKSYADMYNARLNPNKEQVARGRKPSKQGPKFANGQDKVNIQIKKLETDQINIREPSENRVLEAIPQSNHCGITTMKDKLPEDTQRSRLDGDILNAFKENPYTQSLASSI
tara:strand:+ start:559 stop:2670 length:2112 start_codon:yes stop_codon:yes gene_type:complete